MSEQLVNEIEKAIIDAEAVIWMARCSIAGTSYIPKIPDHTGTRAVRHPGYVCIIYERELEADGWGEYRVAARDLAKKHNPACTADFDMLLTYGAGGIPQRIFYVPAIAAVYYIAELRKRRAYVGLLAFPTEPAYEFTA